MLQESQVLTVGTSGGGAVRVQRCGVVPDQCLQVADRHLHRDHVGVAQGKGRLVVGERFLVGVDGAGVASSTSMEGRRFLESTGLLQVMGHAPGVSVVGAVEAQQVVGQDRKSVV